MSPSPFYNTGARYGIRATLGTTNISDLDTAAQAMRDDIEAKMAGYSSGTHAARLAATALDGYLWRETDSTPVGLLFLGNGTTWQPVGPAGAWTALTLGTGVTAVAGYTPSARPEGDVVRLKGALSGNIGSGATWATIATAAQRPSSNVTYPTVLTGAANILGALTIATTGVLTVSVAADPAGSVLHLEGLTFPVS